MRSKFEWYHGKIRTGPRASLRLRRLPVQPKRGQGEIRPRAMLSAIRELLWTDMPGAATDGPDSITDSHSKACHIGGLPHQADTVALDEQLESTLITRKGDPSSVHPNLNDGCKTMCFKVNHYTY